MSTYKVRIFGYRGVEQMPLVHARQFSADSVYQLVQPYEFSEVLTVTDGDPTAVSSLGNASDQVQVLRIEVPDGKTIRYEVNPPNRAVAAGDDSPQLSGVNQFYFRPGWKISVVDAVAFL